MYRSGISDLEFRRILSAQCFLFTLLRNPVNLIDVVSQPWALTTQGLVQLTLVASLNLCPHRNKPEEQVVEDRWGRAVQIQGAATIPNSLKDTVQYVPHAFTSEQDIYIKLSSCRLICNISQQLNSMSLFCMYGYPSGHTLRHLICFTRLKRHVS